MCTITIAEHRRRPRRTLRTLHIRLSKTFGAFGAPRPSAKLAHTLFLTPQNTVNAPLLGPTPLPSESPAPFDRALGLVQARARCVNAPAYEELRRALGATLYNPTIARRELGAAAAHAARHAIARVRCLGGCSMHYSPHAFYAADPASRAQIRRGTLGVLTDACSSPRAAWTVRCAARSRLACPRCGGRRAVARARGPEHGRGISGRSEFEHGAGLQASFYSKGTSPGAYPLGPPLLAKIVASLVTRYTFSTSSRQRLCSATLPSPANAHARRRVRADPTAALCRPEFDARTGARAAAAHAACHAIARTHCACAASVGRLAMDSLPARAQRTAARVREGATPSQRSMRQYGRTLCSAGVGYGFTQVREELRRALDAMLWNPTIAPREFGAAAAHAARRAIARVRGACAASERRLGADGAFPCPKLRERSMRHSLHTRCRRHPPQMLARPPPLLPSSVRLCVGPATDEQRASTKLRVATRMCRCLPGLRNLAGPLCTARQVQRVAFGVEHPTAESSFGRVVALHQCMNDFPDDKINDDASKYAADMTKASITEGTRAGHSRQVV
ncbi:hypothetical protein GGX14DRAFT_572780 [Mycena pura]|uniref:Uncharacterized protein n=1 Tax=Mycena pura TaxID=153505 RepID=A0AAD6V320_9AGAR|nr:hypothetical protein GGX14DRAFT_572780 [Mycena pura]